MATPHLIIGNKNYSSWSLRPWLALRQAGIEFEETLVPLFEDGFKDELLRHSPAGKVPILHHGEVTVWESLAILEYLAETFPDAGLWPAGPAARALARTVSAEMHAGFGALRTYMPMNLRKSLPGRGRGPRVAEDVARVTALWNDCRARFGDGGPFLFGAFCNADAMFAPVVTRLETYVVDVDSGSRAYMDAILALPAMKEWTAAGCEEPWVIEEDEV